MDWKEWKGKKRSKATMSNHDDIYRRIYPHFMKKKHDTCWWFLKRPNALRHQWYHLFGWMIWKRKNISTQFGYHIHLLVSCCRWAENLNENENLFGYHEALLHLTVQLRRLISVLIATRSIIIIKRVDKIYIKSRSVSVSSWKLIHFVVAGKFTPGVRGPGLLFSSSAFSSWSASVQALPKTENQTKNQIMDKSLHFVFSTIRQFVGRISAWLLICWWFAAPIESQSCKVLFFLFDRKRNQRNQRNIMQFPGSGLFSNSQLNAAAALYFSMLQSSSPSFPLFPTASLYSMAPRRPTPYSIRDILGLNDQCETAGNRILMEGMLNERTCRDDDLEYFKAMWNFNEGNYVHLLYIIAMCEYHATSAILYMGH